MSALATAPRRRPSSPPQPRRRPQLRVVGPPRHGARYVAAMLLIGAAAVFGIVSLSALAAEAAFSARALESEIDDLTLRYEELTAEVAALEAPARVRAVAIDELGMVPAGDAAFLVLDGPLDGAAPGATVVSEPDPHDETQRLADPLKPALGAGG